jgi:hypothetical protein
VQLRTVDPRFKASTNAPSSVLLARVNHEHQAQRHRALINLEQIGLMAQLQSPSRLKHIRRRPRNGRPPSAQDARHRKSRATIALETGS